MNATKRSAARTGLVVCSVLAVALTGCRTYVVHPPPRTVYAPEPPPVVYSPPAPAPQPPPPVVVVPPPAQAPVVVIQSENDFYEPLAAYGRWEVVGSYGRCWIPARVETGWRPYSNGYWQRTDAGWYWASEEPWGWATYHYGRWDFHAQFGWVWVPQTQWAPAWVAWREGGGYVGWAPLRPSVTIGVSIGAVNYEPAFASRAFVFVEHRRMLEPVRPKTVIVNNTTIINQTVNITNVKVVNKTVINEGPRPEVIERESGRKVQAVPVHEFRRREEAPVAARQRNIPTAPERRVQPSVRTESQPAEKKEVTPPVARPIEQPAQVVTQPPPPRATPGRPRSPRPDVGKSTRDEKGHETDNARKITTPPPTVEPEAKPKVGSEKGAPPRREDRPAQRPAVVANPAPQPATELPVRDEKKREAANEKNNATATPQIAPKPRNEVRTEQTVPPRREVRPGQRPTVATNPTSQPVTTSPDRDEKKRETATEKKDRTTPSSVQPRPGSEVRPGPRQEMKPPGKVGTAPSQPGRKQVGPTPEKPADKRLISPKDKSRAAEQAEADKKKKEDKGPKKKGEDEETRSAAPSRPPQ